MHFDFQVAWESLPKLLAGAGTTFAVLLPVLVIGLLLALPVALASFRPGPRALFASSYIGFFRGVPSLVMLARMPGIDSGSVMVRNVRTGPAPRLSAAFS